MTKKELNLRFLARLDFIGPKLKHTASGTGGNHPNLRLVWLRACQDDIKTEGWLNAMLKWRYFIGIRIKQLAGE